MDLGYIRSRVTSACDNCKLRKVKCDGKLPCSYCVRRHRASSCCFSPRTRRPPHRSTPIRPGTQSLTTTRNSSVRPSPDLPASHLSSERPATPPASTVLDEEADVHREARLLCDAHGKLIFIGDCAPLSFFQTVRQFVISRVDPDAFAPQTSQFSMLENASGNPPQPPVIHPELPKVDPDTVDTLLSTFAVATSGLVDLTDGCGRLADDIAAWSRKGQEPHDIASAVKYLVLAIGAQTDSGHLAASYYHHAKTLALASLDGNVDVGTVQAFALISVYMLRACQINGAFLFFGIAVRAAYSIGAHRAEVNSRFGHALCTQRNRLWRSLRVLDLFLSVSQGRPPATSDEDCTVPYRDTDSEGREAPDILNASVQILTITERVVLEVYSKRKITLQLTEGISRQLRDWSARWLSHLKGVISATSLPGDRHETAGACQVLASYYYCVILVSRPFLVYELYRRVSDDEPESGSTNTGRHKLANACIDSACLMSEMVLDLVERGALDKKSPLLVSWLFASALVIGTGLLAGFGSILDRYVRKSISALEFFAGEDTHAMQYSLIAKSLRSIALQHLEAKEVRERARISEASSQLFGLKPREDSVKTDLSVGAVNDLSSDPSVESFTGPHMGDSPFADIDSSIFSLNDPPLPPPDFSQLSGNPQDQAGHVFGALNLFPLLEGNGHIDLAHYY